MRAHSGQRIPDACFCLDLLVVERLELEPVSTHIQLEGDWLDAYDEDALCAPLTSCCAVVEELEPM